MLSAVSKTEHFKTAKISGKALKQRIRTHSVLRRCSSQLQKYKAARMSRRIAVGQKVCRWDGRHSELTICNLQTTRELRMRIKYARKLSCLYYVAVIRTTTRGKNRHEPMWAIMINLPELPINDEGRKEAHIASTGARRNEKLVMNHKIS